MLTKAGLEGKLHKSGLDLYDQTSRELHWKTSFLRGMPRVVLRPVCPAAQALVDYGSRVTISPASWLQMWLGNHVTALVLGET